ncbi:MAG TPA: hypothetical protein VGT03_02030 [Candidatus Acidoferrales bacterium]|nr:hypothetical protein [Candidatus Acidoferrales bacterium]
MSLVLTIASLLLLGVASPQDKPVRVGELEFFGYQGLDLNQIRPAIPVHAGDEFPPSEKNRVKERIKQSVETAIGRPATDVATICCDNSGQMTIYVGLPGKSSETVAYNPAPSGAVLLPAKALELYKSEDDAVMHAVQNGRAGEDDSEGYALSVDPALRSIELQMREYATRDEPLFRRVLQFSSHADDREAAAEILGYANQSQKQIDSLVHASYDPDDDVRNNAVRALGVLASSSPKTAGLIPASGFIAMLNSGVWTDRNKAGFLILTLTQSRNPGLLDELRARALPSLIEMALWDASHAYPARMILGRVAGIDETRLQKLVDTGQVDAIINSVQK